MKAIKKVLSVIIAICFMVNNVAFAFEQNTDTLAVPTKLTSIQFQQVAQIEIGIREALKGISGLDLAGLAAVGKGESALASRSVFGPKVDGRILFREAEELDIPGDAEHAGKTNYGVRAVVDGVEYGCILSFSPKTDTYEIVVVPYEVYVHAKTNGAMQVVRDTMDKATRDILNRYIEHEVSSAANAAIDPWIAAKMSIGEYAVDSIAAEHNPLYKHEGRKTFDNTAKDAILAGIGVFLKSAGATGAAKITKAMTQKPLVFIPYRPEEELPVVTINNTAVRVTAHSSQFATYLFVPQAMFDEITTSSSWERSTISYIETELVHEAGAICGLPVTVQKGMVTNVLDMAHEAYITQGKPSALVQANGAENIIKDARPINLLKLEERNDYASGKVLNKKSSFKRTMAAMLAAFGIVGMAATTASAQTQIPPMPTLSTTNINLPSGELIQAAPNGVSVAVTDGAYIDNSLYNFTPGSGTNKVKSGTRLMSEVINGVRHVYAGFSAVGTNNIQSAVNSASLGSIVLVKAGTYTGDITLKDGVKLMGGYDESGNRNIAANTTVINGKVIAQNITSPTELNGFTVKVQNKGKGVEISGCGENLVILNNVIRGADGLDLATSFNMGIKSTNSQAVIYNNTITNCHWFGIYAKESSLTVENNMIHGNYRDGVQELYGNSIYRNNFFWDNGLMPNSGSHLLLFESASTLERNTLYGEDVGVLVWNSDPVFTDNIFTRVNNPVWLLPRTTNVVTETGNIKDPKGDMNLGIDPVSGVFTSPAYPANGYDPAAAVRNYNKTAVYGMTIDYTTGTGAASWATGGYSYDLIETTNTVESVDLSGFSQITVGIQGTPSRVKMEVRDVNSAMKSVYLTQVSASKEGLWYVASSELTGIDLSRVTSILFVVEGDNITGKVSVQTVSGASLARNIQPATGLTTNDINLATTDMTANFYPTNASATATNNMATGVCTIQYTTSTNQNAWAAGGFTYDNLGTTNLAEVVDLSRLSSFVLGVRGTLNRYKVEVRDLNNNKASVYLIGVTNTEQMYSIPVSLFTGIDLMKIRDIVFVAEGNNKTGTIYVRTLTRSPVNPYDFGPTAGLGANDVNLTMPITGYFVQSSPNNASLNVTSDGFAINSNGSFMYSMGGGFNFAGPVDYSKQTAIVLGLQGQLNTTYLPVTFTDADGKTVTMQLNGVDGTLRYWMIPTIYLRGIDMTRIVKVSVAWSGSNLSGSYLQMHGVKAAMTYDVAPSAGYTTNNVNLGSTGMYINPTPAGSTSTVTNMGSGITRINYTTATASNAWAAGGLSYDNLGTTNVMENTDLSGIANIVIGLRSDLSKVKMEVEDVLGVKSSVYLTGVTTSEQFWSISESLLSGVDFTRVRFISFVAEGDNKTGSIYVRTQPTVTPSANIPYASGLTATNINLTTKDVAGLAPAGSTGAATATSNGMTINYNTGTNAWAGGMFNYDLAATPAAIETIDMSGIYQFIFGVKGDSSTVKVEFKDSSDHTAVVYLTGIDPVTEHLWSIDRSYLAGVDLSKIMSISFIVEGTGKAGTLSVHSLPTAQITPNVIPSAGYTTNNVNLGSTGMYINPTPAGSTSTVTNMGSGITRINYTTATASNAWAAGGLSYDNLGTTNVMENTDLSGIANIVIGLRSDLSKVKMEVEDVLGAKASVYLTGVTTSEQFWSISESLLSGVDFTRVRFISFVAEGDNKTGSIYVRTQPTVTPSANIPYASGLTATNINLTTKDVAGLAPAGSTGAATATSNGMTINYNTGTNAWAGGMFNYDLAATPAAIETIDMSGIYQFIFGVKGDSSTVKVEFKDSSDHTAVVYLTGIDPVTEHLWSIDRSYLAGVDLSKIMSISFIVEGTGKAGTLSVHSLPTAQITPDITPSAGLSTNDINLATTRMTMNPHPAGATSTVVTTPTGIQISYANGTGQSAWSGGSFSYDNLGTTNVMESMNLTGYTDLVIGMRGSPSQVKMEVEDITGAKASVNLKGITASEQIWSAPVSLLTGIDLGHVRFITFVVSGDSLSGSLYVDSLMTQAPQVNIPADATLTAGAINVAVTTMTKATASAGAQSSVTNLASGLRLTYNTGVSAGAWAATQASYDAEATTNVVETYDLTQFGVLKFGLKGTNDTVKLEIEDNTGKKVAVNLIGIDPNTEKIWAIDPAFLIGTDLTHVRALNFVMEGANKAGTLDVRTLSSDQVRPVIVSTPGATAADINLQATYTMELPRATIVKNAIGFNMIYNTSVDGWAGGGLSYDNFGTPPVETRDLSGIGQIKIGLKGPVSRIKMEVEDAVGRKSAVYLDGIDAATEKIWSVPTSYFPNIDLTNVRFVLFIVEGVNLSGSLDVHVVPQSGYGYAMLGTPAAPEVAGETLLAVTSDKEGPSNLAMLAPLLGMLKRPSRKKLEAAEARKIEKTAIADLKKLDYLAFPEEAPQASGTGDAITEVLWQAGQGEITATRAKEELVKLAPDVVKDAGGREMIYDAWLGAAKAVLIGLGLSPIGKNKAPADLDIRAVADKIKSADIEIYIPSSQIPAGLLKELKKPVENIFGDKLRIYQNIEDLQSMVKDPARAIIMTVGLTNANLDQISKLKLDIGLARFMNFENVDPEQMSVTEYENYFTETLSMLIIARVITMADMQDKGSPTYRLMTHLLESHMDAMADIDAYISNIVDTSIAPTTRLGYILKSILKAIPVSAYTIMKPAVEVLWSA